MNTPIKLVNMPSFTTLVFAGMEVTAEAKKRVGRVKRRRWTREEIALAKERAESGASKQEVVNSLAKDLKRTTNAVYAMLDVIKRGDV